MKNALLMVAVMILPGPVFGGDLYQCIGSDGRKSYTSAPQQGQVCSRPNLPELGKQGSSPPVQLTRKNKEFWRCVNSVGEVKYSDVIREQSEFGWKCLPASLSERVNEAKKRLTRYQSAKSKYPDMDIDVQLIQDSLKKGELSNAEFLLNNMKEQLELHGNL